MKTLTLLRSILSAFFGLLLCLIVAGLGFYVLDGTNRREKGNGHSRKTIYPTTA